MVPSELMAQLIASLLQRAPCRLWVTSTGPIGASSARSAAKRGSSPPSSRPSTKPPVRGAVVDAGLRHRAAPDDDGADHPLGADDLGDVRFAEAVLEADHRAVRRAGGAAPRAPRSTTCGGWVASKTKSNWPGASGSAALARPATRRVAPCSRSDEAAPVDRVGDGGIVA